MSFTYYSPNTLVFGSDGIAQLEGLLREHQATSILLVYSGDYIFDLGIHSEIIRATEAIGASVIESGDVVPNPRIDLVRSLIDQAREHQVDFILAVGGASSFDTAKAVGVGVPYQGDVWDLFLGKDDPVATLPVGVIATLAGSGSEVSDCAVLQQGHDKRALETRLIIPRFSIVDPAYSATAPKRYQGAAVADLAVGFVEPYFSNNPELWVTDHLLEGGLEASWQAGLEFAKDPSDVNARTQLHWLSATAYNGCFLSQGRETDWTTHRIEHELGGEFDVIHGEGISAILPSIIRYVGRRHPERYAQLAARVFHVDPFTYSPEEAAMILAQRFEDFFTAFGLATNLHELNIPRDAIEHVADELTHGGTQTVGNYYPLSKDDVIQVLELAY
jgi:alcohol dehydrogenase YqhD (iron-dependent ADH family)